MNVSIYVRPMINCLSRMSVSVCHLSPIQFHPLALVLVLGVILPLDTESEGVVVEILPYELGQPFKKLLHHQLSSRKPDTSSVVDVNMTRQFFRGCHCNNNNKCCEKCEHDTLK